MPADVVPIGVPGRGELWHRVQLARAVLNQRAPDSTTVTLALAALDGFSIETLMKRREPARVPLGFVVDWQQIGRDARAACAAHGVSKQKLATLLGVGPATVRRLLHGGVLSADLLVSVVAWLYPEESRPKWVVSSSVEEAV